MGNRTDDIRQRGGKERGGMVGGTPFLKWGDDYAWIEGRIEGTFETKYGLAATFKVSAVHEDGLMAQGKDDDGEEYTAPVTPGTLVNVGLASAALQGKIEKTDVGKAFHIAFEGWEHPSGGNRYRVFAVIELTERDPPASVPDNPDPQDTTDYPEEKDDGLPF